MFDPEKEIASFTFTLYRCAIAFKNELNKEFYKEFQEDLSADFWFVLTVLWEEDNLLHSVLADKVSRDKASLSRTLDLMEEFGLVKRITDAKDKRLTKIALTKKSYELKDKANLIAIEFTKKELRGLSPIEIKELVRMINKVFDNLHD